MHPIIIICPFFYDCVCMHTHCRTCVCVYACTCDFVSCIFLSSTVILRQLFAVRSLLVVFCPPLLPVMCYSQAFICVGDVSRQSAHMWGPASTAHYSQSNSLFLLFKSLVSIINDQRKSTNIVFKSDLLDKYLLTHRRMQFVAGGVYFTFFVLMNKGTNTSGRTNTK